MAEITNGGVTLPLKKPVKLLLKDAAGNETEQEITHLVFKKPEGKDFRAFDRTDGKIGMMFAFGASLTGLPERVFDKLDGEEDLPEVLGILAGFLRRFREIFETL